jgi:hypothetical protein
MLCTVFHADKTPCTLTVITAFNIGMRMFMTLLCSDIKMIQEETSIFTFMVPCIINHKIE